VPKRQSHVRPRHREAQRTFVALPGQTIIEHGTRIMDDAEEIDRLLATSLAVLPAPRQLVVAEVMAKLKEIVYSSDSALWRSMSDQFIEAAVQARLETDAQFYLMVGSACIACSVTFARQARWSKQLKIAEPGHSR
jgi:hypothetical protein